MIYFLSISLAQQVHASALGFTSYLNLYACGDTPQEAEEDARAYLLGNGIVVKKFHETSVAREQDPARYTFIEQIYGLPQNVAVDAIKAKPWPEGIVESTLATLRQKVAQLHAGRKLLAQKSAA